MYASSGVEWEGFFNVAISVHELYSRSSHCSILQSVAHTPVTGHHTIMLEWPWRHPTPLFTFTIIRREGGMGGGRWREGCKGEGAKRGGGGGVCSTTWPIKQIEGIIW